MVAVQRRLSDQTGATGSALFASLDQDRAQHRRELRDRKRDSSPSGLDAAVTCRNEERACAAKHDLKQKTDRTCFSVLPLDVADLGNVRRAVAALPESLDALVMNAGGAGGPPRSR